MFVRVCNFCVLREQTMLQFVYPTLYVKPVKQITFLCHSITVTSGMIDCSDDRLEEFKLENIYCGEILGRKNV